MGTIERRQRKKEELRSKILDAARELFATLGYESVTMRQIADRIEYTPTTLYLYFKDKRALLEELCRVDFGNLASRFGKLREIPDVLERIKILGKAYVRFAVENPNHYRLMFMTAAPKGEEEIEISAVDAQAFNILLDTVKAVLSHPGIECPTKDPYILAQPLWASMHGIAALEIVKYDDKWLNWRPLEERVELMIDALGRGLFKQEQQ